MRALVIHLLNGALLIIILIGVPSVTSMQLVGKWAISSTPDARFLTLVGLVVAVLGNLLGAAYLARSTRTRSLFYRWMGAFLAILIVTYLHFEGHISFGWLKDFLVFTRQQIQKIF